jgi:hypothetical protein
MSGEYASPGRGAVPEILREPISERGGAAVLAAALGKFRKRKTFSSAKQHRLVNGMAAFLEFHGTHLAGSHSG